MFSALLFASCKKDLQFSAPQSVNVSKKDWDQTAQAVAKDVAEKLNNFSFRRMLKHEVLLRFDGDANILLSSLINRLPKYLAYEASEKATKKIQHREPQPHGLLTTNF